MKTPVRFHLLLSALVLSAVTNLACSHRSPRIAPPAEPAMATSLLAGTTLALRVVQVIDSSSSQPGRAFAAVVSRDANDANGQTVLPAGSPATLVLLRTQVPAAAGFELALASVMLNGNSYLVSNGSDAAGSTGASLGAFLGGVPGTLYSPSSEQIGEASQLVVSRDRIHVPLGSLITFRLDRSVRLVGSP